MNTFADVQAQIETINNIANLGEMALGIYPKQFNYLAEDIPTYLLPLATGNKYNTNLAVPGVAIKQYDARTMNQEEINHFEINDITRRLNDVIKLINDKGAFTYQDSFYIIHDALK